MEKLQKWGAVKISLDYLKIIGYCTHDCLHHQRHRVSASWECAMLWTPLSNHSEVLFDRFSPPKYSIMVFQRIYHTLIPYTMEENTAKREITLLQS